MPAPRRVTTVTGWQGVPLHVPEWGDADGPPLVLIHGWSQAHPCWERQLTGPLERFRLIAPDLRGHGRSGKPMDPDAYSTSAPWAHDLQAILDALDIRKAVLVGWSMGGWTLQDYLRVFGDARVAGYCLVGTSSMTGRYVDPEAAARRRGDADVVAEAMMQGTLPEELAAATAFLRACFHTPPDPDSLARMVGYNMLCPPLVRRAARTRHEDYAPDLAGLTAPCLVLWGAHERLAVPPMPQQTIAALPHARGLTYEHSGHAPFWEEPGRFNTDLAAFAAACLTEEAPT